MRMNELHRIGVNGKQGERVKSTGNGTLRERVEPGEMDRGKGGIRESGNQGVTQGKILYHMPKNPRK